MSVEAVRYLQKQYIEVMKTNEPETWKEPLVYSEYHCAKLAMIEARYIVALERALADERRRRYDRQKAQKEVRHAADA